MKNNTQDSTERELELMKELAKAKDYLVIFKKFILNNDCKYFRVDIIVDILSNKFYDNIVYIINESIFNSIGPLRFIDSDFPEVHKLFIGNNNSFKEYLKSFKENEDYILLDKNHTPIYF